MPKIVLFGATGYTGRLVAGALVAAGAAPLLAGRDQKRLDALAAGLGGLETAIADAARPESLRALLEQGDVLVSTVGPFALRGAAALRAGEQAARIDVGYLLTGRLGLGSASSGTVASIGGLMLEPSFAWRGGRIVAERTAARVGSLPMRGRRRPAVSIGGTAHFALPRIAPSLREVNVYLGGFGQLAHAAPATSALVSLGARVPGVGRALAAATGGLTRRSGRGPDESARSRSGSDVVAIAYDAAGGELATVLLEGLNSYTFSGGILAWGARRAAEHGVNGTGALSPVDAFGLEALEAGVAAAGFRRVDPPL